MGKIVDLIGKRFGQLLVVGQAPLHVRPDKRKAARWVCVCSCGVRKTVMAANLVSGSTVSCGCYARQRVGNANRKHGQKGTPEYKAWLSMRARCRDVKNRTYGARGISVCERWSNFAAFLEDMGRRPTPRHSLDRIDVNGHYSPENCRWATPREQQNNKRNTVVVTYNGKQVPLIVAAEYSGIKYATLHSRLMAGWPESKLFQPVK